MADFKLYYDGRHCTRCLAAVRHPGIDSVPKDPQLEKLNKAYDDFVSVVNSLTPEAFLHSLGDWTPRDVVAHLIGWNYNIRQGCQQIRTGAAPFYHGDALNDYRTLNAEFIARFDSTDRAVLLRELEKGRAELTSFLNTIAESDWDRDFGARHYRGGPATIARSVASLTQEYLDHAREITGGR